MIGVKKNVIVFFGLFLIGMLFVPTAVESAWADWTFEGFIGEPFYCPGSDWPDNCWFNAPQDVAIDSSDNIYVVSFFQQKVYKLNSAGNLVLEFSVPDRPREVDVDGSGNIYVSLGNPASSIAKYSSSGNLISQFSVSPGDFAVDNAGNIYVTPTSGGTWQKFDSSGNLLFTKSESYNITDGIEIGPYQQTEEAIYFQLGSQLAVRNLDGTQLTHVSFPVNPLVDQVPHQIGIDGSGHLYTAGQNGLTRHDLAGFTHGDLWNHSNTDCGISATATAPFDLNTVPLDKICNTLVGRFAVNSNGDVYAMGSAGGNTHAVLKFSHVAAPPELTITNLNIYEAGPNDSGPSGHMRYDVDGSVANLSPAQPLTSIITDSNGNVVHQHPSAQTTASPGTTFGMDAPVFYQSGQFGTEYSGTFTLTVCIPEFNVCDSENFTVDTTPSGTVSKAHQALL